MIEKGRRIEDRSCPKRKTKVCVGCKPCSITTGFAGAGAFSDGKLSLSPDVGGNLPQILGYEKTEQLLKESDQIYLKFGADTKVYGLNEEKEIELFIKSDAPERLTYPEAKGYRHLAIKTTNIEEDRNYLISQGVKVEEIRQDEITDRKMLFFYDPDDLPIELHE